MSEGSNQHSAVSNQHSTARRSTGTKAKSGQDSWVLLSAECQLLIAAFPDAIPCTVTRPDTSVTTLPLVGSGLIIVGRGIGRWAETAASRGFARGTHCSFKGVICIQ